jgi:predicted nucleic acid-binding protein
VRAAEILRALPTVLSVTENALDELKAGKRNGHRDADQLESLIGQGLTQLIAVGPQSAGIYESLIEGSTARTLDDGEAATIACATECGGVAIIDEKKARSICVANFPLLPIATTVDVLLHESVVSAIGPDGHVDALFRALRDARMRVVPEQLLEVVTLLGEERASLCKSLPKIVREAR